MYKSFKDERDELQRKLEQSQKREADLQAALKDILQHAKGQYVYDEDGNYVEEYPIEREASTKRALAAIQKSEEAQ